MSKFRTIIFIILCLGLVSCGKAVEEVNKGHVQSAQDIDSKNFSFIYEHTTLTTFNKTIPRNANFKIPESIEFITEEDVSITQNLHLTYNMAPDFSEYEFKCVYRPNNITHFFELVACYNRAGSNLGGVIGVDFMLDEGKTVVVQSLEVNPFQAIIHHFVEWK